MSHYYYKLLVCVVVENHAPLVHTSSGRVGEHVDTCSERVDQELQAVGAECWVRLGC
jgi:hypothetical protein